MHQAEFLQLHDTDLVRVAEQAQAGLLQPAAAVSPKFLYDTLGSRLFDAITALDEYYPTRTEAAIFAAHSGDMAAAVRGHMGSGFALVDLGAGNCAKAARLFGALQPQHYVAVDISTDFLRDAVKALQAQHPALRMTGVGLDFSVTLALPKELLQGPALLFYPGSSIGNFNDGEALRLLQQAHTLSAGGGLLIGVDLAKPAHILQSAYDDALGVTAAFNLNLLRHLNRLLGSDFNPTQWQHVALYNEAARRIEMHLQARVQHTVRLGGGERREFALGERIHTENSYKWQRSDFEALLRDAGFSRVRTWTDPQGWFAVMLALAT
jgi:L-histidine Nalpha-methyltransferase